MFPQYVELNVGEPLEINVISSFDFVVVACDFDKAVLSPKYLSLGIIQIFTTESIQLNNSGTYICFASTKVTRFKHYFGRSIVKVFGE